MRSCGNCRRCRNRQDKSYSEISERPPEQYNLHYNEHFFSSVKSLLKPIAKRINAGKSRLQDEMWSSILEKLSDGMLLIVDEAQFLTYSQ